MPFHLLPNLLFRIVEQADIRIRIDDDALFHLVVVAAPYVAVLYHFLVGDAQYPESIYREMSQSHHLAFILMKQETQFSLFQSLTSNRNLGLVTLAEVYRLITTDAALKENAGKFRYFRTQGFDGDADRIKRSKSLVFTPAAVFDGKRRGKNRVSYTQYSLVDIDKLEEGQAERPLSPESQGVRGGSNQDGRIASAGGGACRLRPQQGNASAPRLVLRHGQPGELPDRSHGKPTLAAVLLSVFHLVTYRQLVDNERFAC